MSEISPFLQFSFFNFQLKFMKLRKLPYLTHFSSNKKNKTTLFPSTLNVGKNKVVLFFHFELKRVRYCHFIIFFFQFTNWSVWKRDNCRILLIWAQIKRNNPIYDNSKEITDCILLKVAVKRNSKHILLGLYYLIYFLNVTGPMTTYGFIWKMK